MNFLTIFPETENVHLTKDVGMIGYILYKYYGYNSTIASYKNSENYSYLHDEVKGLKLDFIKRVTGNSTMDGIIYLFKNVRNIDVLNIFHITLQSCCWIAVYKILNRKGKVYLKLDADYRIKEYYINRDVIKWKIKRTLLKKCNLISVETKILCNYINDKWKINVEYIPNGFYDNNIKSIINYEYKENVICTVGRIGTFEKATDILLEGFKIAADNIQDWKLKIIGPIEEEFKNYINEFFKANPRLKERIIFKGPIYDRQALENEYKKAKIFCLSSRKEGFPLVFLEAIKNGCYIISSDLEAAYDVTDNQKYGTIFPIDNSEELAKCFSDICNQEYKLRDVCSKVQDYAYENFYWPDICRKINNLIKR